MRRSLAAVAALLLAGVLAGLPSFISAQSTQAWPTFHGDTNRDGVSTVSGPQGHDGTADVANQWLLPKSAESSPAVDANGTAYVGDDDSHVYALNASDGARPIWSFKTNGPVVASPSVSPDGKTLYVGDAAGYIYAIKTADGSAAWSSPVYFGGRIQGSVAVSPDGTTLYASNVNGTVASLSATDGKKIASVTIFGLPGSVSLSADGSTLFVASANSSEVYALPATGSNALLSATPYYLSGAAAGTPAVDPNGNIFAATIEGSMFGFSEGDTSGNSRCVFQTPSKQPITTAPAIVGGTNGVVIFGSEDQSVYALNLSSCTQQVWSFKTGAPVESSPAVAKGNSLVYVGSNDGNLYALKLTDGSKVWQRQLGGSITSPALGSDGSLWVASNSGYVYRLHDLQVPGTPVKPTGTITVLPTLTPFPTSTAGPSPTPVGLPNGSTLTLKAKVKPGQKQTVKVHTAAKTAVRFRVNYPNGDHQSHRLTTNASGNGTYTFKQGDSKIKHNAFIATVLATIPGGTLTKTYTISLGTLDVSVEPRAQSVGKMVDIFVHAKKGTHVAAYLLFPNGSVITRRGTTGPKGWSSIKYRVGKGRTSGSNHKVTVLAKILSGGPRISTSSSFTIS